MTQGLACNTRTSMDGNITIVNDSSTSNDGRQECVLSLHDTDDESMHASGGQHYNISDIAPETIR